jgi:hypothetical protein
LQKSSCSSTSDPRFLSAQAAYEKNLTLSHSGLKQRWHSDSDSMDPAAEHRIRSVTSTNNIHCPCGRTFEKRGALDMHQRDSKIHRAERMHSANESMCLMPNAVQLTTPNAPAPASPPPSASTSMLDMSLLEARLLRCTCGQHFETQRILEPHKRDSLYHQHHADDASTVQECQDDSLVSAFLSMTLNLDPSRLLVPVASLTCICGCIFSTQEAFNQHSADAARYAWLGDREGHRK